MLSSAKFQKLHVEVQLICEASGSNGFSVSRIIELYIYYYAVTKHPAKTHLIIYDTTEV